MINVIRRYDSMEVEFTLASPTGRSESFCMSMTTFDQHAEMFEFDTRYRSNGINSDIFSFPVTVETVREFRDLRRRFALTHDNGAIMGCELQTDRAQYKFTMDHHVIIVSYMDYASHLALRILVANLRQHMRPTSHPLYSKCISTPYLLGVFYRLQAKMFVILGAGSSLSKTQLAAERSVLA